ncbi:zinc finger HIT domain-containing protein 1 isoform X1 [Anas acuta]
MRVNVDKVLERDQKLSELDDRADALQAGASQFETSAAKLKRKYWWKNLKMMIILGVICAIVLIIIIGRVPEAAQRRVLDRATRQRRLNRQLEALENDNFGDDPQAGLPRPGKRLPHFADTAETGKKKKKTRGDHFKLRFRKNFQALLEEQNLSAAEAPNYVSACAAPSRLPQRHFCAVCGFPSAYTCVTCGARYCSSRCLGTHQDTRCLKWTV